MPETLTYTLGLGRFGMNMAEAGDINVTPVDIMPDALIAKLYREGSHLVALGELRHPEFPVTAVTNALLESPQSKPQHFFSEWSWDYQTKYDAFAAAKDAVGEKAFRDIIVRPTDSYAPKNNPALRQEYFDTKIKTYEITKKQNIAVHLVDNLHTNETNAAIAQQNTLTSFVANANVMMKFYDSTETFRDPVTMSDAEFEARMKLVPADTKGFFTYAKGEATSHSLLPRPGETIADKKAHMKTMSDQFFAAIGMTSADKIPAVFAKTNQKNTEMTQEWQRLSNIRDAIRERSMASKTLGVYEKDTDTTGLMLVGGGHIEDTHEGRTELGMMDKFRKMAGLNPKRIDIMSVDPAIVKVLGKPQKFAGMDCVVCIGGMKGADYTILIPARVGMPIPATVKAQQPAAEGPHKDKLKDFQIGMQLDGERDIFSAVSIRLAGGDELLAPGLTPASKPLIAAIPGKPFGMG